jgi:hypothetical protein
MRVRVVLGQSPESNAVGSVELECLPLGLLIVYLGVGAYSAGYAVGALTEGTRVTVPWTSIDRLEERGDHVLLSFDARISPHHRLCLARFADGKQSDANEVEKQRKLVRYASIGLMCAVALSLAAQLPSWSEKTSQGTAALIAAGVGLAILVCGLFFERYYFAAAPTSSSVKAAFLTELAHYRPVLRTPVLEPTAAPAFDWSSLIRILPRSTLAIVIVLSTASLTALATSGWVLGQQPAGSTRGTSRLARESVDEAVPAIDPEPQRAAAEAPAVVSQSASPAAAQSPIATGEPAMAAASTESCRCPIADSVLWGDGFPRITTLLIEQATRRHKDHQHLELELGAINNGGQALSDIRLSVLFFEGESKEAINERPLYYEGPLRPGQAIKWHVQSRGTRFEIRNPTREVLKDRQSDLAPADAFARLLTTANHRPVRLHGAMMLAYLGDPRSKQGALGLRDALREVEAPYLDRVIATQSDVLSCDWRASPEGRIRKLSGCLYNRSGKKHENVSIRGRALDRYFDHRSPTADPPVVLAEQVGNLKQPLDAGQGVAVVLELDTENSDGRLPVAFELLVDETTP